MAKHLAGIAVLLISWIFGVLYYIDIAKMDRQDKMVVEVLLAALAVILVHRSILAGLSFKRFLDERHASGIKLAPLPETVSGILKRKETLFLLTTIPYIIVFPYLGFFVSSFIYVLVANLILGTKGWIKLLAIPSGLTVFTYLLFGMVFGIRLPKGILF